MDKSTKYIFLLMSFAILGVVGYRYNEFIVEKHYLLNASAPCDPSAETCFVADCDPESDPECDSTPYKKVEILSSLAPSCLEEHSCESFSCDSVQGECSVAYCSPDTQEDGERCAVGEPEGEEGAQN